MNMMENTLESSGNEMGEKKHGYLMCIHCDENRQLSVGVEKDGEAEDGEPPAYKPVADINEAMTLVQTIYRNEGQMPKEDEAGLAAAQAGYAKKAASRPKMEAPGGMFGE